MGPHQEARLSFLDRADATTGATALAGGAWMDVTSHHALESRESFFVRAPKAALLSCWRATQLLRPADLVAVAAPQPPPAVTIFDAICIIGLNIKEKVKDRNILKAKCVATHLQIFYKTIPRIINSCVVSEF